jgi:hypothetical protein
VIRRAAHAASADFPARLCRQNNIYRFDPRDFRKHSSWFIAQSTPAAHLAKRFPQNISQKAYQDMGLDAFGLLMPDRTNLQVALMNPKGSFGFGQLNIRLPKFPGVPIIEITPQQIAAFAEIGPVSPGLCLAPHNLGPSIAADNHICFKQSG